MHYELITQIESLILSSRILTHEDKKKLLARVATLSDEQLKTVKALFEEEAAAFARFDEMERATWQKFEGALAAIVNKYTSHGATQSAS